MLVLGVCAFVAAGYLTFNVQTSCTANAQLCCAPEPCTSAAGGMAMQMGVIGGWSLTNIGIAFGVVTTNFTLAMTAFEMAIAQKIYEVQQNNVKWWDEFWFYNLRPAMQAMTIQMNVSDADQSRVLGSFGDAMDLNRTNLALAQSEIESHRALRPTENECVAATVSGGMAHAAAIRRAYNSAAPVEALERSNNATGSTGAGGTGADMGARWANYVDRYCEAAMNAGNAGCAADATFAGRDIDVAGEIFSKDTIDVRDGDTKQIVDDLVMNIAEPFVPAAVPAIDLWGYAADEKMDVDGMIAEEYRGIRPAPGYPANPDHTQKETLWQLMDVEKNTGIILTESLAMWPASSVSGWYFAHPDSYYFGVNVIGRDQLADYAARRKISEAEAEKWLAPILD